MIGFCFCLLSWLALSAAAGGRLNVPLCSVRSLSAFSAALFLFPMNSFSQDEFKVFKSQSPSVQFAYPADFILSEKPVKTHNYEVYLRSEKTKGYNEGLTVSPLLYTFFSSPSKGHTRIDGSCQGEQSNGLRFPSRGGE